MAALLPPARLQFSDGNGNPYAGGTIDTLLPGTDTQVATWQDAGATVLNANPIVLDAAGRCTIYGTGQVRTVLKDAAGVLVWDQVTAALVSSAMAPVMIAPDIASAAALLGVGTAVQAETTLRLAADATEAAAREAADSTEAAARLSADTALQAALTAEQDRAEAAEAALGVAAKTQAGSSTTGGDGVVHVTFPMPFATLDAFVATPSGVGFYPFAVTASPTTSGADVRVAVQEADGTNSPVPGCGFFWIAVGT